MKRIIIISIALAFVSLYSCTSDEDKKKAELEEYKTLVTEYTEKIKVLESEIGPLPNEESKKRPTSVEVKELLPEELISYFESKGSVEAVQDAFISPEISGQIKSILVEKGDRVVEGQLLVKLNTEITSNSIEELKKSLELSDKIYQKQSKLWERQVGSEIQYLEAKNGKESLEARLKTLESQLKMAFIRAPFSGIVDDVMVKSGEIAAPGGRLIRLVNLDEMRISAEVSEAFLSSVNTGDMVKLSFPSFPENKQEVPIKRIGTVIDPITRTFTIEVLIDNKKEMLKPNMLSSVMIQDYNDAEALVVPSIILKQDFSGTFLFLAKGEKGNLQAKKIYVKPGKTVQDVTKILDGLNEGDKVIISGFNLVSDGEAVSIMN